MDVLCSTAMRTRVDTGKKRVFHAFFLAGGCSTSELFNTQATLAKLFVRGASRAVASGWSVKKRVAVATPRTIPWRGLRIFWGGLLASGLQVHARSRCRYFARGHAGATEAIRTVRRRAPSATRPIRSVRRGRNRSCPAPFTRTCARDCPRRNPSTLAMARTRRLLLGSLLGNS